MPAYSFALYWGIALGIPAPIASLLTALARPNRSLLIVLAVVPAMLALTLIWPFVAGLFRFGPLQLDDLAVSLGAGVVLLTVLECGKALWRRRQEASRP